MEAIGTFLPGSIACAFRALATLQEALDRPAAGVGKALEKARKISVEQHSE